MSIGEAMMNKIVHGTEQARARRFKQQLSGFKTGNRDKTLEMEDECGAVVKYAADTFDNNEERLKYAMPIFIDEIKNHQSTYGRVNTEDWKNVVGNLINEWNLKWDDKLHSLMVGKIISDFEGGEDIRCYANAIKSLLPENDLETVYYSTIDRFVNRKNICNTEAAIEISFVFDDMDFEESEYDKAYDYLEQAVFDVYANPEKNKSFNGVSSDNINKMINFLYEFANRIELDQGKKQGIYEKVSGWLNDPEDYFKDVKVEKFADRDKEINYNFLYSLKSELCPELLDGHDYVTKVDIIKSNDGSSLSKAKDILISAEKCNQDNVVAVNSIFDMCEELDPINSKIELVENLPELFEDIVKSDESIGALAFDRSEKILKSELSNGNITNNEFYKCLSEVSEAFLPGEKKIEWLDELTSEPFIINDNESSMEFVEFLHSEFSSVAKSSNDNMDDIPTINTKNVSASLICGNLVIGFSNRVSDCEDDLFYDGTDQVGLLGEDEMANKVFNAASYPQIRNENISKFKKVVAALSNEEPKIVGSSVNCRDQLKHVQ